MRYPAHFDNLLGDGIERLTVDVLQLVRHDKQRVDFAEAAFRDREMLAAHRVVERPSAVAALAQECVSRRAN